MQHKFREHGIVSIHVDLVGRRSHVDASDRHNVSVSDARLREMLPSYDHRYFDLHKLRSILNEIVLWR